MVKVSVLMPVYKTKTEHLKTAIESILNQTFSDFEFLILDDCPTDNREEIVKSYHDKRIKYFKNEENLGISKSRNKLIDMAKGEYLAIFDHDDISLPTRLEKEVKFLDENIDIGVVSAFIEYIDCKNEGKILSTPEYNYEIKSALTCDCFVVHTASMIRKSILDNNNIRYEEFFSPCEDYQLWNRLMDITRFYNIQEVLVKYRAFDGNTSHLCKDLMKRKSKEIQLNIQNRYPAYFKAWYYDKNNKHTYWRIKLFGLPFLKMKGSKIYLFNVIPFLSIRLKK